jgi:RNA polymerase sigma-70 factor, ECF subfamily
MYRQPSICQVVTVLHPIAARSVSIDAELIDGNPRNEQRDREDVGGEVCEDGAADLLRYKRSGRLLQSEREGGLLRARSDCFGRVRVSVAATSTSSGLKVPIAEAVWSELHDRLRAFVARRVPDRAVVDDLAQEILLRLYAHIGRLREQERLDAWAYQVARNVIADYWRHRAARRELPLDHYLSEQLASLPELDSDETAAQLRSEIAMCLAPMVERLARPYREAIRLTDLGDRTQPEAAAMLGLSVPGMKARVQRGRAQLRELLRACCQIELDRRGRITELEPHGSRSCGCHRSGD